MIPRKFGILGKRKTFVNVGKGKPTIELDLSKFLNVGYWYPEYTHTTLLTESIRALNKQSLQELKDQLELGKFKTHIFNPHIKALQPYHEDLIKPLFKDKIDKNKPKQALAKVSQDYKQGKRGFGSRKKLINVEPRN